MKSTAPSKLIIAVGNDLRGDDGVGAEVVRRLSCRHPQAATYLVEPMLTPELADQLPGYAEVYCVDASVQVEAVELRRVEPGPGSLSHHGSLSVLLSLCRVLHGRVPPAYELHLPAREFTLGAGLSRTARRAVSAALELLEERLCTN